MGSRRRRKTPSASPPAGLVAAMQRRARVAELALRGWRTVRIATEVHAEVGTVANDLKRLEQGWREAGLRDFDRLRGIEAAKLDEIERCAWDAFDRSREAAQKRTKRKRRTTGGKQPTEVDEATVVDADRVGDPRFLHIVLEAIADRRKLFGLDKPTKVTHTDVSGNQEACGIVVYLPSNRRDENRVDEGPGPDKLLESP
ncbi:MAG TPA: hypothetical protein VHB77_00575 [Planctomycetaceae bacterium]|nr:hypothetical protein [Planctomycetaceae bacterium]